jgi:hypothetical protein
MRQRNNITGYGKSDPQVNRGFAASYPQCAETTRTSRLSIWNI